MLAAAQVRQLVAQRLLAVALTAGRVFEGRYHPAAENELPCWFVSIEPGEDIETEGISWPGLMTHRLRIRADGFAASTLDLETQLDTLQLQGLQALFATQPPFSLRCVGTRRRADDDANGGARLGALTLHLEAVFHGVEGEPETLIP
jgi:hypothetical protein